MLTINHSNEGVYRKFCQELIDAWGDQCVKRNVAMRPHWAKEFDFLSFYGTPHGQPRQKVDFLNWIRTPEGYGDALPVFKKDLEEVYKLGGVKREEAQKLFSTRYLDDSILYDWK